MSRLQASALAGLFVALAATACSGSQSELTVASPGLERKASVKYTDARQTALGQAPGGEIESAELEEEGGRLVYSFDIDDENDQIVEVLVDARSGDVVSRTVETAEQEKAEADADRKGEDADEAGEHED
ncbi:MAG: PepSY domain-containing protein [Gemmatimonadales bacterium]|jgi:hypothetical protein